MRAPRLYPAASLVALAALAALPARAQTLVVLNKADSTASLLELASGRVVATLPTGQAPHETAVSPDGRTALVSNYGTRDSPGSTLTVIDVPGARVVRTIDLRPHHRPHGVQWLRDGRHAVVTAEESKALLVVDVEAGDVEAAIETGQEVSHMVALTPDGRRAFVASIGSGTVTAIDVAARKALGHVATGKGAEGIDVTPDGREVWVTNREADSVSVLDAARFSVLATLESKSFPIRVRITPDGRRALVSNARSGDVAVFDVAARKLVRRVATKIEAVPAESRLLSFPGSSVPIGIVVTPDGARAFVAHANADAIAVLDLRTWEASGRLRAGREPDGMAFSPVRVGQP